MKLLKAAVIFVLVPTLTPAFDPLTASVAVGSAAIAWHLFSSDSWFKCRFQECCKKNNTLSFRGKAVARTHGDKLVFLPGVVRTSFGGIVENEGYHPCWLYKAEAALI